MAQIKGCAEVVKCQVVENWIPTVMRGTHVVQSGGKAEILGLGRPPFIFGEIP